MGKLLYIGAGIVAFILVIIGNPLWVSTKVLYPGLEWFYFGLGIGLMLLGGAASMVDTSEGIIAILELVGFLFTCIWFLACFPTFITSLV